MLIEGRNINKSYGNLHVLKEVDIELNKGEVVSLVGSSGAGKSTLLQILGTLDLPDSGNVLFEGKDITRLTDKEKSLFRNRELGFVFQFHHLLPEFDALENVCIPAYIASKPIPGARARARELLGALNLGNRTTHRPSQLSGGEQQRVAIARALMNSPKIILADEPTGNLDSRNSEELYELIFKLAQETGVAFLIATHNEHLAGEADRIIKMKDGRIVSQEKGRRATPVMS